MSVFWMDAWVFPLNRGYSKAILFDAYQVRVRHVLDTPGYSKAILFDAYQVCVTGVPRT